MGVPNCWLNRSEAVATFYNASGRKCSSARRVFGKKPSHRRDDSRDLTFLRWDEDLLLVVGNHRRAIGDDYRRSRELTEAEGRWG